MVSVAAASSVTPPVVSPEILGTSLVPVMVIVMVSVADPSFEVTVKVSVKVSPSPSCWMAVMLLSTVYSHAPFSVMVN